MKTQIKLEHSHPNLWKARQERFQKHEGTAGLIIVSFAGALLLGVGLAILLALTSAK